jgi:uncharacterized protein YijF (DUF1287 family)
MIDKTRLSVDDIRQIPVGATMSWRLENGAAIISARNLVTYLQRHDGRKFTTKADFAGNGFEITRLS